MLDPELSGSIKQLRAELKEWEKVFAAANHGRKAARDDIKNAPEIAAKYKEYNRLTGRVAPRASIGSNDLDQSKSLKRRRDEAEDDDSNESGKRVRQLHVSDIDPYDLPLQYTPSAVRTYVGPTPQKNGQVLGLFDGLSPAMDGTPSRRRTCSLHLAAPSITQSQACVAETQLLPDITPPKTLDTPSKHSLPDKRTDLITPSTQRVHKMPASGSSQSRLDETPAFLKRYTSKFLGPQRDPSNETDESFNFSPVAVRLPPRPVGKGLSALIQGLRHMEEDRLDEELDLLREMEAEESGGLSLPKKPVVLVEDSQILEASDLPLGADGEGPGSDEDELAQEAETTRRPWKKKGQKRTTRKANIAPSTAKRKPEPEWMDGESLLCKATDPKAKAKGNEAPRKKISATAHANFRALKIHNKNSKGKGGKFRGRRR